MINLTPTQLRLAADLKEKIAGLETQLAGIIYAGGKTHTPVQASKPAKRKMSPAHIAKIKAAQKLRWAKHNAAKAKTGPKAVVAAKPVAAKPLKKGGMSAEGKARIVAAQKARWAKIHAEKGAKTAAKPVVKAEVKIAPKPVAAPKPIAKPAKKKISAEGIARIKAAQKARWAKVKAAEVKK